MTLLAAAVVPGAPLLVPEIAGGSADADLQLRRAAVEAVAWLLDGPGHVLVVGDAPSTGPTEGTWDWAGFGVHGCGGAGEALPTSLAIGAWLLDTVDPGRPREYLGVDARADALRCRGLGSRAVAAEDRRLLVVADGSACRSEKAPGHLDPRAPAYDETLLEALRHGDSTALLGLDPDLGRELLVQGRAPLQVLAGAALVATPQSAVVHEVTLDHVDDPYGVLYLVARWLPRVVVSHPR